MRGQDINKPVILFLHGGPGDPGGPLIFQAYAGLELEKDFVMAYLHQRNTCLSPDVPTKTLTIKQHVKDVDNVVNFLKEKFQKDKIFLMGHSFGGLLGFLYLLEHEDNIEKIVTAGSPFSLITTEIEGYESAMEMLEEEGSQEDIEKLKATGPPPFETFQDIFVWRKLASKISEKRNEGMTRKLQISKVESVTGVEFNSEWEARTMVIIAAMWEELRVLEISDKVHNINVPLLAMTGAKDITVPFHVLKKGYKNYGGKKESVILEKSNHFMFIDETDLFVSKVVDFFQK